MGDASSVQVRVLSTCLKKSIKKKIAKLDREIQLLQADISRCNSNLKIFVVGSPFTADWRLRLSKVEKQREKLDSQRKQLRLMIKGCIPPF